ncbi:MAG: helix-turn-helix domain-containing protein [Deltaproteobacteria bacterium]|nr:helix-turn-helix domain-containing protein [Deltaproteobacteria bacterium]
MTTRRKKTTRLTQALLETANDMHKAGILTDEAYGKITMRHLRTEDKDGSEPLTGEDIRAMRERAQMSQAVFAHYLNVSVGYVSQLERGTKRPTGAALVLLKVIKRKGIEAILE